MVLAEKYSLKSKRLIMDPQIQIAPDQGRHIARVGLHVWAAQFRQEFKQPGFDHWELVRVPS